MWESHSQQRSFAFISLQDKYNCWNQILIEAAALSGFEIICCEYHLFQMNYLSFFTLIGIAGRVFARMFIQNTLRTQQKLILCFKVRYLFNFSSPLYIMLTSLFRSPTCHLLWMKLYFNIQLIHNVRRDHYLMYYWLLFISQPITSHLVFFVLSLGNHTFV